ncbi:MAG: Holliday junction resolvase RuvX [Bacteroidetes bacterium]|nr:Holliday junction resolvase RuvX [Bacteroidota bacterium]
MGRIIAIDFGQKRVGVAVTDPGQMIAGPLDTVASMDILAFLEKYIAAEDVECIVVGEPRQMNNEPSESARFIEPFVKKLIQLFPGLKIDRVDERFTSKMASQAILASGAKKKDRQDKGLVDRVSAVIMLQTYLETKSMMR